MGYTIFGSSGIKCKINVAAMFYFLCLEYLSALFSPVLVSADSSPLYSI